MSRVGPRVGLRVGLRVEILSSAHAAGLPPASAARSGGVEAPPSLSTPPGEMEKQLLEAQKLVQELEISLKVQELEFRNCL
jgi:hypothetical protein